MSLIGFSFTHLSYLRAETHDCYLSMFESVAALLSLFGPVFTSFLGFFPLYFVQYPCNFLFHAIHRDPPVLWSFILFSVYSLLEILYYASDRPRNIMRSTMMIRPVLCALLIPAYIISRDRVIDMNQGAPIELDLNLHIEAAVQTISPIAASYIYTRSVTERANFFLALAHEQKQNETDGGPVNMVQRCGASAHQILSDQKPCLYEFSYIQFVALRKFHYEKLKRSSFFEQIYDTHVHVPQQRLYVAEFQRIFFNAITVNFIVIMFFIIFMKVAGFAFAERSDVLICTSWRFRRIGIPVLVVCTWVFKHMYVNNNGFPFPENPTEQVVDHKFIVATMCFSDHILTTIVCGLFVLLFNIVVDMINKDTFMEHEENPFT
jgi:hypothetical protein